METQKIFIINAGQVFAHSSGRFNQTISTATTDFFQSNTGFEIRTTNINEAYDPQKEVENFVWADVIIYHTPIWWFSLPFEFKKYLDLILTAGHQQGIYHSDGRSSKNPAINYGTGGQLHGKKYMLTTSWNAPATAFTLPGEFFGERSVDDGPLFGFHRMNAFTGLEPLASIHFHDVEKNADIPTELDRYHRHLTKLFIQNPITHEHPDYSHS